MDRGVYQRVESKSGLRNSKFNGYKPFLRQLIICSGIWISTFMYGLGVGAPTVFIPQIRREANNTEVITEDMASWLTSIYGFSAFPCVLIMSMLARFIGRKIPYFIGTVSILASFIVLYCSTNVTHIIISGVIQGLYSALQLVVTVLVVTEYTSPKYRGMFLTINAATFYWGVWASNAIGTVFHWKIIPLFGIICACYTLLTICMWPESPYWLVSRGKFEQCVRSHRWLKGCDDESENELEALIASQNNYLATEEEHFTIRQRLVDIVKTMRTDVFYKPTLLSVLIGMLNLFSGKFVCAMYALDIIKTITSSESVAYAGMLILDGVTVFSMYCGCILIKYFRRRTLLFFLSSATVSFLFMISLYLYLASIKLITVNKYISILLLMAFSITVSCGPLMLSSSVLGELIPVRSRNLSICIIALIAKIFVASGLKIAPYMFKTLKLHGTFFTFAILSSVCIGLLYIYLPETKDKTLQEISDSMNVYRKDKIAVRSLLDRTN